MRWYQFCGDGHEILAVHFQHHPFFFSILIVSSIMKISIDLEVYKNLDYVGSLHRKSLVCILRI